MKTRITAFVMMAFLFFALICSMQPKEPVKGYIVAKQWVKAHMSDKQAVTVNEAAFVPVVHPAPKQPEPYSIKSEFAFYVGNKEGVSRVRVDSLIYFSYKCGDRIAFKFN